MEPTILDLGRLYFMILGLYLEFVYTEIYFELDSAVVKV